MGDLKHPDEGRSSENTSLISSGEDSDHSEEINLAKLLEVNDVSQLDEVIAFIGARLAAIHTEKPKDSTSGALETSTSSGHLTSWIKRGRICLRKVNNSACKHSSKIFRSSETRKAVIDVLKGVSQTHWIVAGLGVVAYALDQMDKVSTNDKECIQFLGDICKLAKQIRKMDDHIEEEELREVVVFIVHGSFFCISRMESNNLSRFLSVSMDVQELKEFRSRLQQKYSSLTYDGVSFMIERRYTMLPNRKAEDPKAVGIDDARDEVVKLLDLNDPSTRAVVLYGLGGIGKTTLATAVLSSIDLNHYKYCRVNIQHDCSESHIQQLQQQVLRDLFNERDQLRDSGEGRSRLLELFTKAKEQPVSQSVFLFIDNASTENDLVKLLSENISFLPNGSRVLITIRNGAEVIKKEGVKRCAYRVKSLSHAASIKLLRHQALGGVDNVFDERLNIDGLVKICGGVPAVLNFAGTKLRKLGNDALACENTIDCLKDIVLKGEEGKLCRSVVDEVYNSLEEGLYKDAFLDIAAFFINWDERMVGYIVGAVALQALKEAALVMIEKGKVVMVHDIVQARGRKLSENNRITDHSSLQRVLSDKEKRGELKGIWLPSDNSASKFQLKAEHLFWMKKSLRILHLSDETNSLVGTSMCNFTNLRLLHINGDLKMELENLPYLYILKIIDCPEQRSLPNESGALSSLKMLKLSGSRLVSLPDSFGQLSRLEELDISKCDQLSTLPDVFSQFKFLKYLNMSGCSNLVGLSQDFEQSESLLAMDVSNCPKLDGNAVDKLVKMKSLLVLNIRESSMLTERWREVKETCALIVEDGQCRLHEHPLSAALFHQDGKFFFPDSGRHMSANSSIVKEQLAIVLSMCDMSGPSHNGALEVVNKKIEELASQEFQIVYVRVGQIWENRVQSVGLRPRGTCAWIAPDEKWNLLFGYSIFRLISPHDGQTLVSSLHTLIACGCVSVDMKGRQYVSNIELKFPGSADVEGLNDLDGGFSKLYSPIIQMDGKFGQVERPASGSMHGATSEVRNMIDPI